MSDRQRAQLRRAEGGAGLLILDEPMANEARSEMIATDA
jgi:hypothetical protein